MPKLALDCWWRIAKVHLVSLYKKSCTLLFWVGAYTGNSKGWIYVRQTVADFIRRRDNVDFADFEDIYLTNGASEAVRIAFKMLIRNPNDGVLVPIPQYPLYSA